MRAPGALRRRAGGAALAAAFVAGGCSSVYSGLGSERDVEPFAGLLADAAASPGRMVRVPVEESGGRRLSLAIEERGRGDRDHVVVLIHGAVSDRRVWRFVAADLGADHDLLLVDLPGCGESDCPEAEEFPDTYRPTEMARAVLGALQARLSLRPAAVRLTLVGHSLGGGVILRMLGDPALGGEFPDVRARVDRAVLLAPLDFAVERRDPAFEEIAAIGAAEVTIGTALGVLRERIAESVRDGVDDGRLAFREEADHVFEAFRDGPRRRALQEMLRRAVPFGDDGRPDWERIEALVADYANVAVPCLIVWGSRDETLPLSMGYKLARQIPGARLHVIRRAMHRLPLECPERCAALVREFRPGPAAAPPHSDAAR